MVILSEDIYGIYIYLSKLYRKYLELFICIYLKEFLLHRKAKVEREPVRLLVSFSTPFCSTKVNIILSLLVAMK